MKEWPAEVNKGKKTTHGPACTTVTGITAPLSENTCVIPIFLPIIPFAIYSLKDIVNTAKRTGARVVGPIPLPTRIEKFCCVQKL